MALEAGCLQVTSMVACRIKLPSFFMDGAVLLCLPMRDWGSLWNPFYEVLISSMRASPSRSKHFPKAQPLNTIIFEGQASTHKFWGDTNTQIMALHSNEEGGRGRQLLGKQIQT